jgi:hypothetical protein
MNKHTSSNLKEITRVVPEKQHCMKDHGILFRWRLHSPMKSTRGTPITWNQKVFFRNFLVLCENVAALHGNYLNIREKVANRNIVNLFETKFG